MYNKFLFFLGQSAGNEAFNRTFDSMTKDFDKVWGKVLIAVALVALLDLVFRKRK